MSVTPYPHIRLSADQPASDLIQPCSFPTTSAVRPLGGARGPGKATHAFGATQSPHYFPAAAMVF